MRDAESKECQLNICKSCGSPRDADYKKNSVDHYLNLDEKSGWVVRLKIRKRIDSKLEYVYLEYSRNGLSDCPYPF